MELGLYFSVLDHLPLERALEFTASRGFRYLEIPTHTDARFGLSKLGGSAASKLRKEVESHGLRIRAINMSADSQLLLGPHNQDTDCIFRGTNEEKIEYGCERMLAAAELANRLEIPVITGFTGCEDYSRWFPWPDPTAWENMEAKMVERWDPILRRLDELGVAFGMECHPRQMVYNTETALRSLELLGDHPSWKFNFDPANLMLAGVDPVVFITHLGDHIVNVHAKDGELVSHAAGFSGLLANGPWDRPNRGFRFRVAGWGDLPWRRLITELAIHGYAGPLMVEHEDPTMGREEGVEKAVEFLRPILIRDKFPGRWW
jgi:sugar phosphate isomerase/epimerase